MKLNVPQKGAHAVDSAGRLSRPLYELLRNLASQTVQVSTALDAVGRGEAPDGSGAPLLDTSQFFYLPGRLTGQTGYGGVSANENLILSSTANADKGFIYLGNPAARVAINEDDGLVGINVLSPQAALHLQAGNSGTTTLVPAGDVGVNWDGWRNAGASLIGPPVYPGCNTLDDDSSWSGVNPASLGTNTQKFTMTAAIPINKVWTVTIRVSTLGGTANLDGHIEFRINDSVGNQYAKQDVAGGFAVDLTGLTTTWVTYVFTIDATGVPIATGQTASTVVIGLVSRATGPTDLYTRCTYVELSTGGDSDIARWNDSSGTLLGKITSVGRVGIGTGSNAVDAMLKVVSDGATTVGIITKGAASQSGNLHEWRNSSDTLLSRITSNGTFDGPVTGTLTSVNVADNAFTVFDNSDNSRIFALQLDGLLSGTHTYRPPPTAAASTSTLAAIDLAQTFTKAQTITPTDAGALTLNGLSGFKNLVLNGITGVGGESQDMFSAVGSDGVSHARIGNDGLVILRRNYSFPAGVMRWINQDTTNSNGVLLSAHTNTTGAGATTDKSLVVMRAIFETHDHATRRGRWEFQTSNAADVATVMRIEGDGRVALGSAAAGARLDVVNPTNTDIMFRLTGAAGQAANYITIQNSSSAAMLTMANTGAVTITPESDAPVLTLNGFSAATTRVLTVNFTNSAGSEAVKITGTPGAGIIDFSLLNLVGTGATIDFGAYRGIFSSISADITAGGTLEGIRTTVTIGAGSTSAPGSCNGLVGVVINNASSGLGPIPFVRGGFFTAQCSASTSVTNLIGFAMVLNANGNITTADGIRINNNLSTAIITTHNGLSIQNSGGATVGTYNSIEIAAVSAHTISGVLSGLRMGNMSGGATNWQLAIGTDASCASSFLWGLLRLGSATAPAHRLDIAAGTATIAPIRLASATRITTPVIGCVEFETDRLYHTITTGVVRRIILTAVDDGLSGQVLTSGGAGVLPSWATPASGGVTKGQATVSFGATPTDQATVTVLDAAIGATSRIVACMAYTAAAGRDLDELTMDMFEVKPGNIVVGVSFDILVSCLTGYAEGDYLIDWHYA
jgi:hypothetical protein